MKKVVSLMIALVFVISVFTGCSTGPDLTGVTQKFNEVSKLYAEVDTLVEKNGWSTDEEMLKTHNEIGDSLNGIKAIIEDPKQSKDIDVETLTANLDKMLPILNEYKSAVSVPYAAQLDLAALTDKYNVITALYTKVAADAEANGWLTDKMLVASLNEIADILEVSGQIIEDPTLFDGSNITQADVDEYTGLLNEFVSILTDFQAHVAVPAE